MLCALLPSLAALSLWSAPGTAPIATIPFELVNKAIFVRVQVNDRPLWFVLDTGLQPSVIDLAVAQSIGLELGDPAAVVGAGQDSVTARFLKHAEVRLAGLEAPGQPLLLALPLENLASRSGHPLAGLLGSAFIGRFVITIDYRRHTLMVHDTAGFTYSGGGEILPITFNASGHPLVAAEVVDSGRPAVTGHFVVDIGSGAGLILNTPFVDQEAFLTPERRTVRWIEGQAIGGKVAGVVGRVGGLRLGRAWLERPVTVFARAESGPLASTDAEGDIGAGILEKFTLVLDYARMRIILEPNAGFPEPMEYNRSGFTLSGSGSDYRTYTVAAVAEDSPASDAGLQIGDTLLAIDARPAGRYSLSDLRLKLRAAQRCRLTVQRGASRRTLTLILRSRV
jgi:predicted aspartyl protease